MSSRSARRCKCCGCRGRSWRDAAGEHSAACLALWRGEQVSPGAAAAGLRPGAGGVRPCSHSQRAPKERR